MYKYKLCKPIIESLVQWLKDGVKDIHVNTDFNILRLSLHKRCMNAHSNAFALVNKPDINTFVGKQFNSTTQPSYFLTYLLYNVRTHKIIFYMTLKYLFSPIDRGCAARAEAGFKCSRCTRGTRGTTNLRQYPSDNIPWTISLGQYTLFINNI